MVNPSALYTAAKGYIAENEELLRYAIAAMHSGCVALVLRSQNENVLKDAATHIHLPEFELEGAAYKVSVAPAVPRSEEAPQYDELALYGAVHLVGKDSQSSLSFGLYCTPNEMSYQRI